MLFRSGRMAVTSVSEFAEDFIRALSAGVAGAWRERWWTVDLLLVHGTEALSGTERAQDEFFHLFEALKRRGSRVMLAANRPPSEIAGIDDERVVPEATLRTDLDLDATLLFDVLEAIEEDVGERTVGFVVDDEDLADLHTVGDLVDYVVARTAGAS